MSFDVFLVCFDDGEPSSIRRTSVQTAFGDHVRWEEPDSGWTQYGAQDGCHISLAPLATDPDRISGVSVNRPVRDHRFWESLYGILRLGNVALFFPGGNGPLIAEPSVATHLPAGMIDSLGKPILVYGGSDVIREIESS